MKIRKKILDIIVNKRAIIDPFRLPKRIRKKREEIRKWAEEVALPYSINADRGDHTNFDWEIVKKGAEVGLLTFFIPKIFGGDYKLRNLVRKGGMLEAAIVIEELARVCPGVAVIFGAHTLGLLPIFFSIDLKAQRKFFSMVSSRAKSKDPLICAFAITEPTAGSDAEDTEGARKGKFLTYVKKENKEYVLNGRKVFISNGSIAGLVTVFAALDKKNIVDTWTCFAVQKGMKGFSVGRIENKMGQKASPAAELIFEDVLVPEDHIVGNEGDGWLLNQLTLDTSRGPVGAIATGTAYHSLKKAVEYAEKKGLMNDRFIQFELADMFMKLEAARTLVWRACSTLPFVPSLSSAAKCFAGDTAMEICSRVIDFMGEDGLELRNEVEKAFRDVKLTQIYEGTNQIQRLNFAEDFFIKKRNPLW